MRVAVIGAGILGLVAGRRLTAAGHNVDIYERWPGLGGQVATVDVGDGVLLERYYHHLFPTDTAIEALYEELGMGTEIEWLPSSVAMLVGGKAHAFNTPLDLLRFKPLNPLARVRIGAAALHLQLRAPDVEPYEQMTAREWILKRMGKPAWEVVWGPLLRNKFGSRADEISMAWLWSKLTLRRRLDGSGARGEVLGYPRGGWQPLLERLQAAIEGTGGRVLIDRPVVQIDRRDGRLAIQAGAPDSFRRGHDPEEFEPEGEWVDYDRVVATVPSDTFSQMLSPAIRTELGKEYLARTEAAEYHSALCLLLEIDREFGEFYWTNVADPEIPFLGLIEQTKLIKPHRYGGRRFLYVANYLEPTDPLLQSDGETLLDHYAPGLRALRPDYQREWVQQWWLFREPAAQPIVTPGYADRIPDLQTPADGLLLANTTQIYPEDRGTNYSVELGERVARLITD